MSILEINKQPSRRELFWFGVLLALFAGLAGAVLGWRWGSPATAAAVWLAGGLLAAVYWLAPALRRRIYLGWMYAVFPIGWTVSHALLAGIYYLVVTPVGLALRLSGYDPLGLRRRRAESYWQPRRPKPDRRRYFRQF